MAWSDAARAAARETRKRHAGAGLSPAKLNKRLDVLDVKASKANDMLIAAGRGHERFQETLRKLDPLSAHVRYINTRQNILRDEITRRYGPGAPRRLPTKR